MAATRSLPMIIKGSWTFILKVTGCTRSSGRPLTLMRPWPRLAKATAVAVFFRPKTCTEVGTLTMVVDGVLSLWNSEQNALLFSARVGMEIKYQMFSLVTIQWKFIIQHCACIIVKMWPQPASDHSLPLELLKGQKWFALPTILNGNLQVEALHALLFFTRDDLRFKFPKGSNIRNYPPCTLWVIRGYPTIPSSINW